MDGIQYNILAVSVSLNSLSDLTIDQTLSALSSPIIYVYFAEIHFLRNSQYVFGTVLHNSPPPNQRNMHSVSRCLKMEAISNSCRISRSLI